MNRLLHLLQFNRRSGTAFAAAVTFVILCVNYAAAQPLKSRMAGAARAAVAHNASDSFKITTTSLPNGVDGVVFSAQLASTGGAGKVTWALVTGSKLVKGLSLSGAGKISGTPTGSTNGAGSFKVEATDSAKPAHTATGAIAYIVNPEDGSFRITTTEFPNATAGEAYSASIKSSGGTGAVTYKLIDHTALPSGLALSSAGVIAGKPAKASTGPDFWVEATDSSKPVAKTVTAFLGILVEPATTPLIIAPLTLTGATAGVHYSKTFTASGGKAPYKWAFVGPSAWDGLSLSSSGLLSGDPALPTVGSVNSSFEVKVTDSSSPARTDTATVKISIAPAPLKVQTTSLPAATVGASYSTTLNATGGIAPFTWSIAAGSQPPAGLMLSSSGVLSGKPGTASGASPTTFAVQVKDSEARPQTVTGTVSVQINPPATPLVVNTAIAPAYAGSDYLYQIAASGGTPPYAFAPVGNMPPGFLLESDGLIEGKPPAANSAAAFTVKVTDSGQPAQSTTANLSVRVFPALAQCTPTGSSPATLAWMKGAYSFQLEEIDDFGTEVLSWSLGALTADGKGNVSGGMFDYNGPSLSSATQSTFTGVYAIGTDGRGLLTVNIPESGNFTETRSYCIALDSLSNAVAGAGQMMEDDVYDTVTHGRFFTQGGSNLGAGSVKGSYAFGLQGNKIDGEGNLDRNAIAGSITLDGNGNVTGGQMDWSYDTTGAGAVLTNTYESAIPLTGTYTLDSTGRGTMTLQAATTDGSVTLDFIFYVAGPNQILLLTADPGYDASNTADNSAVLEGRGYLETNSTFNNATLSGPSVITSQGLSVDSQTDVAYGRLIQAGIWTWDGNGNLSGSEDKNSAGSVTTAAQTSIKATYVVSSSGYAALTPTNVLSAPNFYLAGPNLGFGVQATSAVSLYQLESQSVPSGGYTATSIAGSYSIGSLWFSYLNQTAESGEVIADSADTQLTYDLDTNLEGLISVGQTLSVGYAANADGRFQTPQTGVASKAVYFVSPQKAYVIDIGAFAADTTLYELNLFEQPE